VSVETLLPAGYVLGEVVCRNLDGHWGSVLGQDLYNMTVHARGYTLYPFVRTVNFVRDRKRTLTSIYELIDGADADELKEQNNTPHKGQAEDWQAFKQAYQEAKARLEQNKTIPE
jgi:hypothetical protein